MTLFLIASPVLAAVPPFVKSPSNPVLWAEYNWEGFDNGFSEGAVGAACVILEGTTYKMWYSAISTDGNPAIGYATSNDGLNWNKAQITPVLTGGTGAWDAYGVGSPSVLFDFVANKYKMWYTGLSNNPNPTIGYAISDDGISWTNQQRVMNVGAGWESFGVSLPSVIWDPEDSLYKMWYTGHTAFLPGQIGYASSANGINWINRQSVLTGDTWDDGGVFGCSVKKVSGSYIMYYSGFASGGPFRPGIGRADSMDGITNWNKSADNPVLGAGGAGDWDEIGVAAPTFILNGGNTEMWYTGCSRDAVLRIGQASQNIANVPVSSNLSTAGLIAGFAVLIAGISVWSIRDAAGMRC